MASQRLSASSTVAVPICLCTIGLCFVGLQQESGLLSSAGIETPFFEKETDHKVQRLVFPPRKLFVSHQQRALNQIQVDGLTSSSDAERFSVLGGVWKQEYRWRILSLCRMLFA